MNIKLVDDKPEILHELRRRINSYKKLHPNLTSQQIAKRFGMSNSTFNRIENMELRKPTFDQIVKVLKGVGADDDLCQLIKANYPNIYDSFKEHITKDYKSNSSIIDEDVLDLMADDGCGRVLRLAFAKDGVHEDYVQRKFGEYGLESLEKLHRKGFLNKSGSRYYCDGNYSMDFPKIKKIVLQSIKDSFDADGANNCTALNYISYNSDSVNAEKVMPVIISELKAFRKRIREILVAEENKGEDVVWVSMQADTVHDNRIQDKIRNGGKIQ